MEGNQVLRGIIDNIEKVMVGKREAVELVCMALVCDGHILIEDVPGTGKTTLALALAKTIDGKLNRISCTPDVMPSDITGFSMYNPKTQSFEYREGAVMANIFLADEINRTPPKTQSGLLEAMEEKAVTVDGQRYLLPEPFLVVATQNPIEHLGTYPLPEAQLDRFMMKVTIGYPAPFEEEEIIRRFGQVNPLDSLTPIATLEDVGSLKEEIAKVQVNAAVTEYIIALVNATRRHKSLLLGLSPRATLWLSRVAKAWAYYNGRDYVIPDDIKKMFVPVCAHRVVPKTEAKYEHITGASILNDILKSVEVKG